MNSPMNSHINSPMSERKIIPDSEMIAAMPPFHLLGASQVQCVRSGADAERARTALMAAPAWGFDTESKPTFQRGYRSEMGVKASVAVLFGQRFAKSKKVSTSNWAQPELSPSQLLYAANDAYAAWCVWRHLAA
jgi:hypothetical protein